MANEQGALDVMNRLNEANTRMLAGDCSLWKQLLSHGDDVSLYGAQGGYAQGWAEVSARFDRVATTYGGQGTSTSENIARWVGADVAATVDLERHETRLDQRSESVAFVYRTTHVLRREGDDWKVVLRHADPLATFRGPAIAHRSLGRRRPVVVTSSGKRDRMTAARSVGDVRRRDAASP